MKYGLLVLSIAWLSFSACNKDNKKVEEHPKEYVGKWEITKKVYSNGIEEIYAEGKDVFFLNDAGNFRREYRDHRDELRDQKGTWKLFVNPSKDGKSDTTYLLKRTPLFNGTFEEQFRIISKADTELIIEENDWGFENLNSRDKLYLSKK
jgi:hypothetical protein